MQIMKVLNKTIERLKVKFVSCQLVGVKKLFKIRESFGNHILLLSLSYHNSIKTRIMVNAFYGCCLLVLRLKFDSNTRMSNSIDNNMLMSDLGEFPFIGAAMFTTAVAVGCYYFVHRRFPEITHKFTFWEKPKLFPDDGINELYYKSRQTPFRRLINRVQEPFNSMKFFGDHKERVIPQKPVASLADETIASKFDRAFKIQESYVYSKIRYYVHNERALGIMDDALNKYSELWLKHELTLNSTQNDLRTKCIDPTMKYIYQKYPDIFPSSICFEDTTRIHTFHHVISCFWEKKETLHSRSKEGACVELAAAFYAYYEMPLRQNIPRSQYTLSRLDMIDSVNSAYYQSFIDVYIRGLF